MMNSGFELWNAANLQYIKEFDKKDVIVEWRQINSSVPNFVKAHLFVEYRNELMHICMYVSILSPFVCFIHNKNMFYFCLRMTFPIHAL